MTWPLRFALARGKTFHAREREIAGLDEEFIERLAGAERFLSADADRVPEPPGADEPRTRKAREPPGRFTFR